MECPTISKGLSKTVHKDKGLGGGQLILFESLPSTNTWAMQHANDLQHGDVVATNHQTAGKGRFTRQWVSPPGSCLTLSIVFKTENLPIPPSLLGPVGALAGREALEKHSISAKLKWPNDVIVSGKKIAGILSECDSDTIVLGIGLNVNLADEALSKMELMQPATSISIETGANHDIDSLRSELLKHIEILLESSNPATLLSKWDQNDHLSGRDIELSTPKGIITGTYAGITENWELRILDNGAEQLFSAGDVSVKRA